MRIVFRYGDGPAPDTEHLEPGEPVWDDTKRRLGVGVGGQAPVWYMGFDNNGNLLMNNGQLLGSQTKPGFVEWSDDGLVLRNGVTPIVSASGVASAVNYVAFTNAVTGSAPSLAAVGGDTNISMSVKSKGSGDVSLQTGGGTQFAIGHKADAVNFVRATGGASGEAATLAADGAGSSVDLALVTKGGGYVRFGGFTLTADAPIVGYINIRDKDGNVRKLAVIN